MTELTTIEYESEEVSKIYDTIVSFAFDKITGDDLYKNLESLAELSDALKNTLAATLNIMYHLSQDKDMLEEQIEACVNHIRTNSNLEVEVFNDKIN